MPRRLALPFLFLIFAASARAGRINWSCAFNSVNLQSNGTPMDGQMVFELGVFLPGFAPSSANTAQWAANWRRASLALYNADLRHFTGGHSVTSNAPPFAAGTRGYIWGHDGRCTDGEWILLSAPSWSWPNQNVFELPVNWTVSAASQVTVGQANGAGFQMKTAPVSAPLPATGWAEWQTKVFSAEQLADPLVSDPQADPDGDGSVNLAEFALGGHPLITGAYPGRLTPGLTFVAGRNRLTLTMTKRCDRTVNWSAQASTDLINWPAGGVVMLSETAELLTVREDITGPGTSRVFLRPRFQMP